MTEMKVAASGFVTAPLKTQRVHVNHTVSEQPAEIETVLVRLSHFFLLLTSVSFHGSLAVFQPPHGKKSTSGNTSVKVQIKLIFSLLVLPVCHHCRELSVSMPVSPVTERRRILGTIEHQSGTLVELLVRLIVELRRVYREGKLLFCH